MATSHEEILAPQRFAYDSAGPPRHSLLPRETFAVEVYPDGALLGRWKGVELDPDTRATGVDILPDRSVYATTVTRLQGNPPSSRVALFRLARDTGEWTPVALGSEFLGADPTRHYAEIIGADGTNLVIHTGLQDVVALSRN